MYAEGGMPRLRPSKRPHYRVRVHLFAGGTQTVLVDMLRFGGVLRDEGKDWWSYVVKSEFLAEESVARWMSFLVPAEYDVERK